MRYILIAMALFAINLLTSPHNMWSYWAMLGLGLALAARAVRVYAPWRLFGPQWEKPRWKSGSDGRCDAGPGHARSVPVPSGPQSIL